MMDHELVPSSSGNEDQRPVKRRARMALSCQRCRKHRSKCSRSRPACEQCTIAGVACTYLEVPGDLESTALRDRFAGLENQIHSLMDEFSHIEQLTHSLKHWKIHQLGTAGLSIDTHMFHVTDIYSTLIQFAKDNTTALTLYPQPDEQKKPVWLVRNHTIFPNVRLSHFTSLRPNMHDGEDSDSEDPTLYIKNPTIEDTEDEQVLMPEPLSPILVEKLLGLYKDCLLYGAVQPFDTLFKEALMDQQAWTPAFQLLYASIMCHMLPHAYYWHPEIFESMDEATCVQLSVQYYKWAKRLLSSIYFDVPSLTTCHAICNLVLYHIENGSTSVIYIYSGMAVRMALSLQLYREDALDAIAQHEATMFPEAYRPTQATMKQYARSLLWFMYFLDTASSHYHNKPYEIHLDDHVSTTTFFKPTDETTDEQSFFQFLEFHTCQITRDIRRTIFTHPEEPQTSYEAIERIETRLLAFQKQLPTLDTDMSLWHRRCLFKQWIRHHGHWILIHQSYLPTPMSVQRCTTAAFALVELFDLWMVNMDCYFRPCVHELKQACEILLYHVDQHTPIQQQALEGLMRLITVLLKTPVGEIARTRPFVQRVLKAIQK
ncbi:hypothetical protein CU098_004857 [Rhizopus stolonifer]|uniref:Zn(2)-C6 fungal-type domain-containing protein n=1 Tax=Rhizopus stolonifer TaxID=4846 RepID=A0A367KFI4_RHIST|nr:hypothetical protein CU098_004857 [Rhizopus stolonifer]